MVREDREGPLLRNGARGIDELLRGAEDDAAGDDGGLRNRGRMSEGCKGREGLGSGPLGSMRCDPLPPRCLLAWKG